MKPPKVYVDTCILKYSATELYRYAPRHQTVNWGGRDFEAVVHNFYVKNPNDKINNPQLKEDADLLPKIASLAKCGQIEMVMQEETFIESLNLPDMDSHSGVFYGAPIKRVDAPVEYERIVVAPDLSTYELQKEFLLNLKCKRFIQLQKATGAYQGKKPTARNQLLDAFHIWCAEYNRCDYFLTMDYKLIKVVRLLKSNIPAVKVVSPSELLEEIAVKRDIFSLFRRLMKLGIRGHHT